MTTYIPPELEAEHRERIAATELFRAQVARENAQNEQAWQNYFAAMPRSQHTEGVER